MGREVLEMSFGYTMCSLQALQAIHTVVGSGYAAGNEVAALSNNYSEKHSMNT